VTRELTSDTLRGALDDALAMRNDATDALAQDDFSGSYPDAKAWAIGPFGRDESLTFELTGQWDDPTAIGWTSSSVFNPSLIGQRDELVMFYRASPVKESTSSRIGMAHHGASGWLDSPFNPVIYPTLPNELLGCEDPKIYSAHGRYFLFYNGIFPVDADDRAAFPSPGYPVDDVGCDINLAVSDDLVTWTKLGPILDHETSRLWAKGAVIPRRPDGSAVRIGGDYLMYISEGCNGRPMVGRSSDMVNWRFDEQPYVALGALGGHLHEVACATTGHDGTKLVLDFFYSDADGQFAAAQALYDTAAPFDQLALNRGGSLAWGGLLQCGGRWLMAQGWDAPPGTRELYFYTADR
jgi:beta-1,2-mannosidase